MDNNISISRLLGNLLKDDPEIAKVLGNFSFWREFLNAKFDKLIEYRQFSNRLTVAEISLAKDITVHVFDNEKEVKITVDCDRVTLEFSGEWKRCGDPYSAYDGMKTGMTDMELLYKSFTSRGDSVLMLEHFIHCVAKSDKLGLPAILL